jgi:uncharacterized membrane protein
MIDNSMFVLTFVSALGCGLIAGVFFAFSGFVMKALAQLPPSQGIAAMQSINIAVINPIFMMAFLGTAAACLVLTIMSFFRWHKPGAVYQLAGSLFYLIGTILVTMVFNVPRNDALAALEPTSAEGDSLWTSYLSGWTAWNHVRTIAALAAAALFSVALVKSASIGSAE